MADDLKTVSKITASRQLNDVLECILDKKEDVIEAKSSGRLSTLSEEES